ncbi:MAG: glutathionylspermidine synthase family protein [Chloroflexota bacterium]|nr:glutathionylspermidine synthase family protein [Chloroflexota bacterium]
MRCLTPTTDYAAYAAAWDEVARAGARSLNLDAWTGGRRYLSLTSVVLSDDESRQLRDLTVRFSTLLDLGVEGILNDPEWWSSLAWPWPAIELARQEPVHFGGRASLFGRFDCLLDGQDTWQVIEYNADTPSGGREATGLEPWIARRASPLRGLSGRLSNLLVRTLRTRIEQHPRPVGRVGIVSSHTWLEDMAQATWLGWLLRRAGQPTLVGDVKDLAARSGRITLRGQPIDALYRFYPVERLYRHAIFASLCEASIDGRLLMLNGLRGFLAQSKACLAWLWSNRSRLGGSACRTIERHLPPTFLARDAAATEWLPRSVVKHVNGREGDSVVFGKTLDEAGWEARLIEGGYVVQQAVSSPVLEDVEVDDVQRRVRRVGPRYACVGAFSVGGRFGGCYTRLDGAVTSARATYAATLREPAAARRRR